MTTRGERRREAFEELRAILTGGDYGIDFILVEGTRDVDALRFLSVTAPIDVFSHVGQVEHDVAASIAARTQSVLVLTDFDDTGISLAKRITELLTTEGVRVQIDLRRKIGKLMGVLGLKTVESLDDWEKKNG
jgi:5S rRNA maturation endonuclease (ribonuclease M5)